MGQNRRLPVICLSRLQINFKKMIIFAKEMTPMGICDFLDPT